MTCSKCGKELPAGKKFCPACGAPAGSAAGTPSASHVPKNTHTGKKRPAKRLTSYEIEGFDPPKPEKKEKNKKEKKPLTFPKLEPRKAVSAIWAALATPWKFIPPVESRLPAAAKSALTLAIIAILVVVAAIVLKSPAKQPASAPSESAGYMPPGVRLLDETVSDGENGTRIELFIEVGDSVQEASLKKMLQNMLAAQRSRTGFKFNKYPTHVTISAFASDSIFKQDPTWWIGKLTWIDGIDAKTELNMDALLPRHEALGLGGPTREEYLARVDEIFNEVHPVMVEIRDLFRKYEKMMVSDKEFLEKGQEYSDKLYESTREIPGPPWDECRDLAAAFESMLDATGYFQDIFAPDTDVFETRRFNSEKFYEQINEYTRREAVFTTERSKYNEK